MRANAAERQAEQKLKMEADKVKEVNSNFKKVLDSLKEALSKKNEEEQLLESVSKYSVREAKHDAERERIFLNIFNRICGHEKSQVNRNEFIKLIHSICGSLSEMKCIDMFSHFTKKPDTDANLRYVKKENEPNDGFDSRRIGATSPQNSRRKNVTINKMLMSGASNDRVHQGSFRVPQTP